MFFLGLTACTHAQRPDPTPDTVATSHFTRSPSQPPASLPGAGAYSHYLKAKWHEHNGDVALARRNLTLALGFDEESAYLHSELGFLYLASGDLDAAENELLSANKLSPAWERPLFLLGEVAFLRNRLDEALTRYEAALAQDPEKPETLRRLSEALYLKSGAAGVIARLEPFVAAHPAQSYPQALLVRLYREAQDYDKLENALKTLLTTDPDDTRAIDQLATWYDRTGRYEQAIALFSRLIPLLPPHPILHIRLGEFYLKADQLELAAKSFENARAFDLSDDHLAQLVGLAYLDTRHNSQAEATFVDLLERGGDPGNRYFLGLARMRAGRFKPAIAAFTDVDASDKDYRIPAQVEAARCWRSLGQAGKANKLIAALLAESGDAPEAYALVAQYYKDGGASKRGLDLLTEALKKRPEDVGLRYARGIFYQELEQEDQALADMREVLRIAPDHPDALNFVGYLYAERKESLEEAERMIRRAMAQKPEEGYILDSLGYILLLRGHHAEAIKWLKLAAMIEPDEVEILLHLALALQSGPPDAAALARTLERAAALPFADSEIERRFKDSFGAEWVKLRGKLAPKGKPKR